MALPEDATLVVQPDVALSLGSPETALAQGVTGSPYAVVSGNVADLALALEAIQTHRRVRSIVEALSLRMARETALALLEQLILAGFARVEDTSSAESRPRVLVLGSGALARAIEARLLESPLVRVRRLDAPVGATVHDQDLLEVALVVIALEGTPYGVVEDLSTRVLALHRTSVFATYEGGAAFIGPTAVPGRSEGFLGARRRVLARVPGGASDLAGAALPNCQAQAAQPIRADSRIVVERTAQELAAEVHRIVGRTTPPRLLDTVLAIHPTHTEPYPLPFVAGARPPDDPSLLDLELHLDVLEARRVNLTERPETSTHTKVKTVGIVGGGTAGYLTALALRKKLPELEVTVIESSKIPVIGVGEATTALLTYFLHSYLGLDIVDFYERVRPTWKLGIRFEWGPPGDYHFNSPFQFGKLLESVIYEGDINKNCLGSLLMSTNRTPIVSARDGSPRSLLSEVPYAYHLDNRRFVRYLAEEARRAGVRHLDATITEGVPDAGREAIEHLLTDDGRKLRYDLYVDCTGFRSLLLGKALGASFVDYTPSLFTDTAVVADVPNRGLVRPYTVAESMDHGWCWNIPMEEEDHRGYVFSSAFATAEQAEAEMRSKNPGMGDPWTVKFRSGRHTEFWRGNCVAIGNSFAFVEPLQSTAIHMILVEIQKLVTAFPKEPKLRRFQPLVNRDIIEVWDTLRWFLAAHYRFNQKYDTPFWRECRKSTDVSGIEELIELYRERAPIGATAHRLKELDLSTFGVYRYDLLFMGMQLETTLAEPEESESSFKQALSAAERVAARALPHLPALAVLKEHPELLWSHALDLGRV